MDFVRADSDNWPWNETVSKASHLFELEIVYHISSCILPISKGVLSFQDDIVVEFIP